MSTTTTVTVEVTQADIAAGMPRSPVACPVALAATRAVGRPMFVEGDDIGPCDEMHEWRMRTPAPARRFIGRFDAGVSVEPFAFALRLPTREAGTTAATMSEHNAKAAAATVAEESYA